MSKKVIIVDLLNLVLTVALKIIGYEDNAGRELRAKCELRMGIGGEDSASLPYEERFDEDNTLPDFNNILINTIKNEINDRVRIIKEETMCFDNNEIEVVFAYDSVDDEFRKELYPQYKAHRKKLYAKYLIKNFYSSTLGLVMDYIKSNYPIKYKEHYEADDVILSLVRHYAELPKEEYSDIFIISDDKDTYRCLEYRDVVIFKVTQNEESYKYGEYSYMDINSLYNKTGMSPTEYEIYMILNGDSSDNVPQLLEETLAKQLAFKIGNKESIEKIYSEFKEFEDSNYDFGVMSNDTYDFFTIVEDHNIIVANIKEKNKMLPEDEKLNEYEHIDSEILLRNIKLISLISFPITEIEDYDAEVHGSRGR